MLPAIFNSSWIPSMPTASVEQEQETKLYILIPVIVATALVCFGGLAVIGSLRMAAKDRQKEKIKADLKKHDEKYSAKSSHFVLLGGTHTYRREERISPTYVSVTETTIKTPYSQQFLPQWSRGKESLLNDARDFLRGRFTITAKHEPLWRQ